MGDLLAGRIKVCGITNLADAQAAVSLGVAILGFVFHPASPRGITPQLADRIIQRLGPQVAAVGVFGDRPPQEVNEIVSACGLAAAQLHGSEPEGWLEEIAVPVIKAFRVRSSHDLPRKGSYAGAWAFLLDAWSPRVAGGTGKAWDWGLAQGVSLEKPVVLAGGLDPDNVAAAIRQVRPAAVDASSGLEASPGSKDHDKLARFVENALEAFDELEQC